MDSVDGPRLTELCSYSIWSEIIGNLWIKWTTELSEGLHGILLSDLQNDAWARSHVLNHSHEFREDTLVHFEELLCCWLVKREHLHGRDLEALLQDHVDDLTCKSICHYMRLDDAACAIVEGCCGTELFIEKHRALSVIVGGRGTGVDGISHTVCAKVTSQRVSWCLLGVSWPKQVSESLHGVLVDELHSSDHVALHESRQI